MFDDRGVDTTSVLHETDEQRSRERGASLVEYSMLIAFIVLVCIAALTLVGTSTAEPFSSIMSGFS